jgi:3-dehydroquinate dehydratase type I
VKLNDNENIDRLMEQINSKKPDLVEFRLDQSTNPQILSKITEKKSFPAIATDRSGRASTPKFLEEAAAAGFEFVDIDISSDHIEPRIKQLRSHDAQVILSSHDYSNTPSADQLRKILEAERKGGGDVCKIVTTALEARDNLTILDFVSTEAAQTRLVAFAMGSRGIPSRILSPYFGAEFTFASLTEESKTAEGQLSIDNLRNAWQILGIQ